MLFKHFKNRAIGQGYSSVVLGSDPNAKAFYKKLVFTVIGKTASSIKDRYLPVMELKFD